jgi:hypothetical protein
MTFFSKNEESRGRPNQREKSLELIFKGRYAVCMLHVQDPVFRKIIVPWYDSDIICAGSAMMMIFVFLFALRGLNMALQIAEHPEFIWMPLILAGMSLCVFFTLAARLLRRHLMS